MRRLLLMHRLDREGARPHVQRSLDEGSKEVRIAAIGCLGDSPDDLPFLLEQVKAKAKEVRTAALTGIGQKRRRTRPPRCFAKRSPAPISHWQWSRFA